MQMGTSGPLASVLIMKVSLFSRVLINRFHCNIIFSCTYCIIYLRTGRTFGHAIKIRTDKLQLIKSRFQESM